MRKSVAAIAFLLPTALAFGAEVQPPRQEEGKYANPLMNAPVSHLIPGAIPFGPSIKNPLASDSEAAMRGMNDFINFNCVGCHAPNGGGGMGPSLSNDRWLYGGNPAEIFLSIYQGRPNGMPAWGEALPQDVIWELVSYIKSISQPRKTFGETISRTPPAPDKEQVPAENIQTTSPWSYTEDFSNGQKPKGQ